MTDDIISQYLDHLAQTPNRRGQTVSPATLRTVRADLDDFVAWWQVAHQLPSFDPALVQERDSALGSSTVKSTTARRSRRSTGRVPDCVRSSPGRLRSG